MLLCDCSSDVCSSDLLLDADIYGPSIPMMLGLSGRPDSPDGKKITPKIGHGLQAMSIGLLVGEDTPMRWLGTMVTESLQQLICDTQWQGLDFLLIDLPAGSGGILLVTSTSCRERVGTFV